jgi:CheY-like chemotaxis protein
MKTARLLPVDDERDNLKVLTAILSERYRVLSYGCGAESLTALEAAKFYPGDYRRVEVGSLDHRVWSETGCTWVLVTSFHDVFLSGIPRQGA